MLASVLRQRIGYAIAAVAFCAALAGFVGDAKAAVAKQSKSAGQMRYYGGPKYPMWRSP